MRVTKLFVYFSSGWDVQDTQRFRIKIVAMGRGLRNGFSVVFAIVFAGGFAKGFAEGFAKGVAEGFAKGFAKGNGSPCVPYPPNPSI